MFDIQLIIDEIAATKTTDGEDDDPFNGSEDEVYFVVVGGTAQDSGYKRIPSENSEKKWYDVDEQGKKIEKNIELRKFTLNDNARAVLSVNVSEVDGPNPLEVFTDAVKFVIAGVETTLAAIATAATAGAAAPTLAEPLIQLGIAGFDLYKAIDKTNDESIGTFSLAVENKQGKPEFIWKPGDNTNTEIFQQDYNSAYFKATSHNSEYYFRVTANIQDTIISALSYSLVGDINKNLILIGNDAIDATGNNFDNIITGNESKNTLNGLAGNDTLYGRGGNDTLVGGEGSDSMFGGTGDDSYEVDNPGDVITEYINGGNDTVNSSISYTLGDNLENLTITGNNPIDGTGNSLNNIIIGNSANNTLNGAAGNDTLIAGEGDDILDGSFGDDSMLGGKDNDTYYVDSINDTITEAPDEGIDTVNSSVSYTLADNLENLTLVGNDAINGTANSLNNIITGNSANNTLNGGAGNDTLIGGDGNDQIDGDLGADSMFGGQGDDSYFIDNINDTVTEFADEGIDTVNSSISYTLGNNLENLTLTGNSAINGTGNNLNNIITGNNAANYLYAGDGNDIVYGQVGDDYLYGQSGNDTLFGGDGNDSLDGGSGTNSMFGELGNDSYFVNTINDTITEFANEGTDIVYSSITYTLGDNLENLSLTGSNAINGIGNIINNIINGNYANNTLDGKAGSDILFGNGGNDSLFGDIGDDKLIGGIGADILNGGDGIDTASYFNAISGIIANLSTGQASDGDTFQSIENLEGSEINDNLTGDSQNNTLTGLAGDDILNGLTGADSMFGSFGNDTYFVDNAGDTVTELFDQGTDLVNSAINYILGTNVENLNLLEGTAALNGTGNELDNVINGNSGNNIIDGGAGNDKLYGFVGSDTIFGGEGNDWIVGGAGNDILTGGNGIDSFVYNSVTDAGDMIKDFTVGSDKIVLTDVVNSSGFRGFNPLNDGFFSFRQASSGMTTMLIDPDGRAGNSFKPAPFILFNNVSATALNNSSNFVF